MNIKDVKVGMEVKLTSSHHTEDEHGYKEGFMLSVGQTGCVSKKYTNWVLIDGYGYAVEDLEPVENKELLATKDILKNVLEDLNVVILGAIESLPHGDLISMKAKDIVVTEDSVLTKLLNLIDKAVANGDLESLLDLTTAYQSMKNASTI